MTIDMWYGDSADKIADADCNYYPDACEYRGWLYNVKGEVIGDYCTCDGVGLERRFPGIFGD